MYSPDEILKELQSISDRAYVSKMEHFGIKGGKALGIPNSILKPFSKEIGKNQALANALWGMHYHETKLLAIWLAEPQLFTEELAEKYTREAYSWDLVDGLGMKVFPKTPFAYQKVEEWSSREPEFEKRMSFATMVGLTLHDKKITIELFDTFLTIIEREAWDERNFVKKAVNWALRQIGKKNILLNEQAILTALSIQKQDAKSAKWIAADALRELRSEKIQERLSSK